MVRRLLLRLIVAAAFAVASTAFGVPAGHATTTTTAPESYNYDHLASFAQRAFDSAVRRTVPSPGLQARRVSVRAVAGAGVAAEEATVTIGPKVAGQMEARGWTEKAIQEAMKSGKQVRAINKATGNPATRYISPTTGQSVVVDDVTGEVIHVGGPGFKYGPGSGDVP
jgi:membrane carboxypeptidase/penicillin-binding protein